MTKNIFLFLLVFLFSISAYSKQGDDANIIGHVVSQGKHMPFVNIYLEGTQLGTTHRCYRPLPIN